MLAADCCLKPFSNIVVKSDIVLLILSRNFCRWSLKRRFLFQYDKWQYTLRLRERFISTDTSFLNSMCAWRIYTKFPDRPAMAFSQFLVNGGFTAFFFGFGSIKIILMRVYLTKSDNTSCSIIAYPERRTIVDRTVDRI